MADSLKGRSTPTSPDLEETNRRNPSVAGFRHADRELDSCGDSCLFQAVNYYEGEPECSPFGYTHCCLHPPPSIPSGSSFPTSQSVLIMERVSESNHPFQDYLSQPSELHSHPEIHPPVVSQPALGFYPQFSSLVSTAQSMISNSVHPAGTNPNPSTRTSGTDRVVLDRQLQWSRSEPALSSASFASIVAWRRDFSSATQGDYLHEGDTCTPLHAHIHGPSSHHHHHHTNHSVSEPPESSTLSENITSRVTSSISDSGRSSPSEFMLPTSLGYTLTPRGNVRPDGNIRNGTGTRSSQHRLNTSAIRVLRSQSPRGSTSIRSRRISSSSRSLSPLNIGLALYHPSNDGDNLPVLLSPSDRSERDRSPTPPVAASEAGSQTLSEDSRSRFIHPGTPIQMHLPELPSLLEAAPSEQQQQHTDAASEIWLVSNPDGLLGETVSSSTENSLVQDDDDVFGCDKERAKELLDGLETVEPSLVRRYEKVRGEDICIICRDTLLRHHHHHPHEGKADKVSGIAIQDVEPPWNLPPAPALASSLPTCSSSVSDSSIHAFPCAHLFHTTCLFPWLSIKTTCPTCRLDIDPHSLTLRIRQWFGVSDNQEPTYVNVDILGRRIPWHRPPAPSLEEWVHTREMEISCKQ